MIKKILIYVSIIIVFGCALISIGCTSPQTTLQRVVAAEYAFSDLVYATAIYKDKMSDQVKKEVIEAVEVGKKVLYSAEKKAHQGDAEGASEDLCKLDVVSDQIASMVSLSFKSFCIQKGDSSGIENKQSNS